MRHQHFTASSGASFISGHPCSLLSASQSPVSPATPGSQGHSWWLLLSFLVVPGHRLLGPAISLSPPPSHFLVALPLENPLGFPPQAGRPSALTAWGGAPVHEFCMLESHCRLSVNHPRQGKPWKESSEIHHSLEALAQSLP